MKTGKKTLAVILCGAALVVSTVMGTRAYLTAQDDVVNTFTVGRVDITLDEAAVKPDGTYVSDVNNRVEQNSYHLIPGHCYIKDPVVHVDADSENCWIFVKVDNGLEGIEAQDGSTISDQMTQKGWQQVSGAANVFAYGKIAAAQQDLPVFDNFRISAQADQQTLGDYAGKTVSITAYAVQADGFATADEAWAAAGF